MNIKEMKHTSKVTFKILPMDSCSQAGRSSLVTVVFFFAKPRAGRGDGTVGAWEAAETGGRGLDLGLATAGGGAAERGKGPDAEGGVADRGKGPDADGEVEEEALAFCCNFASLFKRI